MDNAAIIGLLGTLLGSVIGARYSYKGALEAVKEQIQYQNKLIEDNNISRENQLLELFKTFLKEEISYNFRAFGERNDYRKNCIRTFQENKKPFKDFRYDCNHFKFDEFNSIKLEIFKLNSTISKEIIDIYVVFKILKDAREIHNLTDYQYDLVRKVFLSYADKY